MGTLLRFLTGDRDAIFRLAAARSTVWAGLLFVLAAGLAEYDGVDLTRESWWLLIPPAASLAVSLVLFTVVYFRIMLGRTAGDDPPPPNARFWPAYRAFLGLFWMTAPLALLYAIPYERFLSPGGAMSANLWTLALVALWRVLLITRVLSVLMGRGMVSIFFVVMLLADVILLVANHVTPKPIFDVMGGVRLSEPEAVLQSTSLLTMIAAVLTFPIWLIGAAASLWRGPTVWNVPPAGAVRGNFGLLVLATVTLIAFAPVLPETQREQRMRTRVERDLRQGRIAEALDTMSAHGPGDFPPQWDPPPRPAYDRDDPPPLLDVLDVIAERGAAEWVRAVYVGKLERTYLHHRIADRVDFGEIGAGDWARVEHLLVSLPEGPALRSTYEDEIERVRKAIDRVAESETRPTTSPAATAPTAGPTEVTP